MFTLILLNKALKNKYEEGGWARAVKGRRGERRTRVRTGGDQIINYIAFSSERLCNGIPSLSHSLSL